MKLKNIMFNFILLERINSVVTDNFMEFLRRKFDLIRNLSYILTITKKMVIQINKISNS